MNQTVKTVPHHDALIYAMVTISAVDRSMTDRELKTIGDIVQTLPIFADFDHEKLVDTAEACGALMQGEDGLQAVLNVIASSLPPKLYETVYALAVDVAAADLHVEQEELRFLQLLRDRLNLEKLVIAAIERGARARHAVA
ncbi:tellurite resistance TerB family protein [Bauldia litoralis]|uniref:Tellurite resistance protein TerB n=1 Tax=Bauldia litoralis TaxID=665467 RepID=A0A1G6E424_9HYPH|nr:tellurite resistance TerB family protein [Bauldia litoralis]SDB52214.1 Tellurite resistance protein TerB [Bauldia litoralis]